MSGYAWIIDRDALEPGSPDEGMRGPSDAPQVLLDRLAKGEGARFKLYDDDGELYYAGRLVLIDPADEQIDTRESEHYRLPVVVMSADEVAAFGPLWDFGGPAAGATEIRYRNTASGVWGTL